MKQKPYICPSKLFTNKNHLQEFYATSFICQHASATDSALSHFLVVQSLFSVSGTYFLRNNLFSVGCWGWAWPQNAAFWKRTRPWWCPSQSDYTVKTIKKKVINVPAKRPKSVTINLWTWPMAHFKGRRKKSWTSLLLNLGWTNPSSQKQGPFGAAQCISLTGD